MDPKPILMHPADWNRALDLTSSALPGRLADCAQHRCNPSSASNREKAQAFYGLVSQQLILRGLLTGVESIRASDSASEDWFGLAGDHQTLNSSAVRGALQALENAQRQWLGLNIEMNFADLREIRSIFIPEQLALWRAVMQEIRLGAHSGPPSRPESNQNAGKVRQDLQQSSYAPSSRLDRSPAKAKSSAAAVSASESDAAPSFVAQTSRCSSAGDITSDISAIQQPSEAAMEQGARLTCSPHHHSSGQSCTDLMITIARVRSAYEAALRTIKWTHVRSEILVHAAGERVFAAIVQRIILEAEYKHSYLMNEIEFAKESLQRISNQVNQAMVLSKSAACGRIGQEQAVQPLLDFFKATWGMTIARDCAQMPLEQQGSLLAEIKNIDAMLKSFQSVPDHLLEAIKRLRCLRAGLDDLIPDQQGSSSRKASRMFADAADLESHATKQPDPGNGSRRVSSVAARSATANQTCELLEEAERKAADAAASLLQEEETEKAVVQQKQKRAQRRRIKQAKRSSHGRESREDAVDDARPEGQPSDNVPFINDWCTMV